MTETSPLGAVAWPPKDAPEGEEHWHYRSKAGRPPAWSCASSTTTARGALGRQVDGRDPGARPLDHAQYYRDEASAEKFHDGWLRTGDIAAIDDGYMLITDRAKDVIKSGGEWISSVELESGSWPTRRCWRPP